MQDLTYQFETTLSIKDCAARFHTGVTGSYGAGRKMLRGLSSLRGGDTGGVEFFTPDDGPFSFDQPDWKAGAFVPGHSKMHGATKMAVHIYVEDLGNKRRVTLIGPYSMGEKGSTERLVKKVAEAF